MRIRIRIRKKAQATMTKIHQKSRMLAAAAPEKKMFFLPIAVLML